MAEKMKFDSNNFYIRKSHLRPKLLEGTHIADRGVLETPIFGSVILLICKDLAPSKYT